MSKFLVLFSFCLIFGSCLNNRGDKTSTIKVPKGKAYVEMKGKSAEIQTIFKYVGIDHLEDINISINSNRSHYVYFATVVDYPVTNNEDGSSTYEILEGELNFVKKLGGCFLYEQLRDTVGDLYTEKNLSIELMVDKKMNSILNNDSLYLSTNGRTYEALPKRMEFSGSRYLHQFDGNYFDLTGIVPIFDSEVYLKENEGKNIYSKFLIGMYNYDCGAKYDFNAMFNSPKFKRIVFDPFMICRSDLSSYKEPNLNIDNFIIQEAEPLSSL